MVFAAAVALVAGAAVGWAAGRAAVPGIGAQVRAVQTEARRTSAGLRVIALHGETQVPSQGDGGRTLVVARTRRELRTELAHAPWIGGTQRLTLESALARLEASDAAHAAADAEALAAEIDRTFGLTD